MFDNLSSSLTNAFKSIAPDGRLTPENIKGPLRDVRRALLEADVSLPVVRRFVAAVEAKALGMEVGVCVGGGALVEGDLLNWGGGESCLRRVAGAVNRKAWGSSESIVA